MIDIIYLCQLPKTEEADMKQYRPLGELLIAKGKITSEQLNAGLLARAEHKRRLGDTLITMGYVSEEDVAECLGEQYDLEVVDVSKLTPDPTALQTLDSEVALENRILPLRYIDNSIECVIADPIDISAMDMISRITDKPVTFRIASISLLLDAIRRAYSPVIVEKRSIKHGRPANRRHDDRGVLLAFIDGELNPMEIIPVMAENLQGADRLQG
jgi:hypothetical protein